MRRVYNFGAGPGVLPEEVLKQASREMLGWKKSGLSVTEMGHRGKEFSEIISRAERDLRTLLKIPRNYKVLFLQGGASSQFAMVPMNILKGKKEADYIFTGQWAKKAIDEAKRYCKVRIAASSEKSNFNYIPSQSEWKLNKHAAYVHITANETINGLEFHWIPEVKNTPLVADMTSNILSRPVDISKFGLIYASSQKNFGVAGLTIVIVRDDLVGKTLSSTPTMYQYGVHAKNDSRYNTPSTYSVYIAGLIFKWVIKKGGLREIEKINISKAKRLYNYIDQSDFYTSPINPSDRSRMNVPFTLGTKKLERSFLNYASKKGLVNLEGHRLVGGIRASLYNAMPEKGVLALVQFMRKFEMKYG